MCLTYSKEGTRKFREKYKKGKKTFAIFYKIVYCNSSGIYSGVFHHTWKAGWNYADKTPYKNKSLGDGRAINNGIHVYTTKTEAMETNGNSISYCGDHVLPVKCYMKDLIGKDGGYKEAVFTKVWVDKAELNKIMKREKREQHEQCMDE